MSFGWSAMDVVAAAKLSWKLYHDCFLVAYDAPGAFRELVNELQHLQATLRMLRDNIETDTAFLDRAGEQRRTTLQCGVENCCKTLKSLENLMARKFYKLATSNALNFWKRIEWSLYQADIEGYRARIMAHTCTISLSMSAIGNSTLLDIQRRLDVALENQLESFGSGAPQTDPEPASAVFAGGRASIDSEVTLVGPLPAPSMHPPAPDEPHKSDENERQIGPLALSGPMPATKPEKTRPAGGDKLQNDASDVQSVVEDAQKALQRCSNRMPSKTAPRSPPVVNPPHPDYVVDSATAKRFQTYASWQRKWGTVSVDEWLKNAAWWLLKSRTMFSVYQRDTSRGSPYSSVCEGSIAPISLEGESPDLFLVLALDNLRKVSWIIYDVVLKDEGRASSLTYANLKLFQSLIHAIHHDFPMMRRLEAKLDEKKRDPPSQTTIWEQSSVIELKMEHGLIERQPCGDHARWLAVQKHDAGREADGERVLFRTFVNGEVGDGDSRNKSIGAPYMLVLWSKDGESESKVTLCSQQGVVHLCRDITKKDFLSVDMSGALEPRLSETHLSKLTLNLVFPGPMPVSIEFLNHEDFESFMKIPRLFFTVTANRYEKSNDETLLYPPVVLDSMAKVTPLNTAESEPSREFCELRIFESSKGGWRRSRRLVFTSSPKDKIPWCESYFLPLDYVHLKCGDDPRHMLIKYSDCNQRRRISQPDGTHRWSREYDRHNPNLCFSLSFHSSADAYTFKSKVLSYSPEPLWQSGHNERQRFSVYKVSGLGPKEGKCKAVQQILTVDGWSFSSLFYVPKTLDFSLGQERKLTARFPPKWAFVTDYISNHTQSFCDVKEGEVAEFKECVKRHRLQEISFKDTGVVPELFQSITSDWLLKYTGDVTRVKYLEIGAQSWFGKKSKGPKGVAKISVWQRGPESKQLLARWDGESENQWLAASLPTAPTIAHFQKQGSVKAVIQSMELIRGSCIYLGSMMAVDPGRSAVKKEGIITVEFATCKEKERFAEASGLYCP